MQVHKGQDISENIIKSLIGVLDGIPYLSNAIAYYKHTEYMDINDDEKRFVELFLITPKYGVIVFRSFSVIENNDNKLAEYGLNQLLGDCIQLKTLIAQNRQLCQGFSGIKIPLHGFLVSNIKLNTLSAEDGVTIVDLSTVRDAVAQLLTGNCVEENNFKELIAVIDGSKILQKNKKRADGKKGQLATEVEKAIALFGKEQLDFIYSYPINGFQILRGLAGSGKTVLLAKKAAELHHNDKNAKIIYTFYTKSLYQTVKTYIRNFFACMSPDAPEPNWNNIRVMHAWGGNNPGVYHDACIASKTDFITYSQAKTRNLIQKPFDTACQDFLQKNKSKEISPICDYMLIDEGQDFPISFVQMCSKITNGQKVIWAYDDLQTIFQENNPSEQVEDIGVKITYSQNLKVCYRNPNEILICAHALGFGLYGDIIQTFENKSDWENLGYTVEGDFIPDQKVILRRSADCVRNIWSSKPDISQIVSAEIFSSEKEEFSKLQEYLLKDLQNGLKPEDILIICLNDREAKNHSALIEEQLAQIGIRVNNLQNDMLNLYDFYSNNEITISTVHKAKGNEAFQVYIVGIEAILSDEHNKLRTIKLRNMLYTAMTRSKGCLTLLGIGENASKLKNELDKAKELYPRIEFLYPKLEQLRLIKNNIKIAQAPEELLSGVQDLKKLLGDEAFAQLIENMLSKKDL